ncbi:MAG: bifunctional proline dehydrogenase/L-glutamate gamma-semialdehyde dehydrogenase PutA [Oceanospirillaceae bacterium]|nr:bifunctional proline dehydrogenase/L-glutamate gamma-semialdehyde dehydrogenase PutA [Oceanospirillaceae bacterium]
MASFSPAYQQQLHTIRSTMRSAYLADEQECIEALLIGLDLATQTRKHICTKAADLVRHVRSHSSPTMMEKFLSEYGLSTKEGVALMCMAEALLRVPDKASISALIEDKVQAGDWSSHLGHSDSSLINSSTWALLVTGKLLAPADADKIGATMRGLVKRVGEPVVRKAVAQSMKELGSQFVLGRTMTEATHRAKKLTTQGYTHSYDMLGEAARTKQDATRYFDAYSQAIADLAPHCTDEDIRNNPGISVKLSALHPRYEWGQRSRVLNQLVPQVLTLALQAKAANMGFNIDAEEADRLDLSLDVIAQVLASKGLCGWNGFGIVVQAFSKRAPMVLDWLYTLACALDRKIMVRLVKGAYWDAEIKRAQVMGLTGFPVFTRKANTDVSYVACAKKLLAMNDRIYAQFATHNAHSVAAVLQLAGSHSAYEFQRLHGMGESLHASVMAQGGVRCRVYAPVGAHQDLLAYLVRRLLENGANSSFVHQLVNPEIAPETIAQDPINAVLERLGEGLSCQSHAIVEPKNMFAQGLGGVRKNAKGWDITDAPTVELMECARQHLEQQCWQARPIVSKDQTQYHEQDLPTLARWETNPAIDNEQVGQVFMATPQQVETAMIAAPIGQQQWLAMPIAHRVACFEKVADLYEAHATQLFAILAKEAGKTWLDAVGELREAVDFARFYAQEMASSPLSQGRGVVSCISPWNFPLAIFSGQILAALAAGNAVLAKPASQTNLVAYKAVQLMHEAGIPVAAVQFLPGGSKEVGVPITSDARINGVCFTGSTPTAQHINRVMATNLAADAVMIAETGGINAMVVDSTALPEQVVRDVLASAFQSAGQRCSALRMLYLQEDIADKVLAMLFGAMDELTLGNPWHLTTDVGPVIDEVSKAKIDSHIAAHAAKGKLLKQLAAPKIGLFVGPAVIKLNGIEDLNEEIFGPVLHVATFAAKDLDELINTINAQGYGLTFGIHTRVDTRVAQLVKGIHAGNTYVNRNQIGAIVGSQPFGGEGLSGTGPKAGGPQYVQRLRQPIAVQSANVSGRVVGFDEVQHAINSLSAKTLVKWQHTHDRLLQLAQIFGAHASRLKDLCRDVVLLPGPTGELNQLSTVPRGVVLCLGPDRQAALLQAQTALAQGNAVVLVANDLNIPKSDLPLVVIKGQLTATDITLLSGYHALAANGCLGYQKQLRQALANKTGPLLPLISESGDPQRYTMERHLCIDTTAAGGNASLIAAVE